MLGWWLMRNVRKVVDGERRDEDSVDGRKSDV